MFSVDLMGTYFQIPIHYRFSLFQPFKSQFSVPMFTIRSFYGSQDVHEGVRPSGHLECSATPAATGYYLYTGCHNLFT